MTTKYRMTLRCCPPRTRLTLHFHPGENAQGLRGPPAAVYVLREESFILPADEVARVLVAERCPASLDAYIASSTGRLLAPP